MVAMTVDHPHVVERRDAGLEAEITFGGCHGRPAQRLDARVSHLGRRSLELSVDPELVAGEHNLWVELTLPDGSSVRPLVEVVTANRYGIGVRIVHLFPDQQAQLNAYHANLATPQLYYR